MLRSQPEVPSMAHGKLFEPTLKEVGGHMARRNCRHRKMGPTGPHESRERTGV